MQSIKHSRLFKSYLILLALIFFSPPLFSATPQKINYQGYVKTNGVPVDTPTNFVFKICDDATCGGTVYCTETANGVSVVKGRFSHLIGTDPACDLTTVPWGAGTLYLQITVAGTVMTPSEEIVSSPYSLESEKGTNATTFVLDRDNTGAGANSKLAFNRGTDDANDAALGWDEANDRFVLTSDGATPAVLRVGVASATTYFGDGSNLTGISASDTTKVLKTGDTMTGPLLVNFNTATESLKITNNTGTGLWIDGTGATAATSSLYVKTNNTNASSYAIWGEHSGGVGAAVYGEAAGTGNGVFGYNSSSGRGVYGLNTSTGNGVYGSNSGAGYAVYGVSSNATTGKAGYFENTNAANTAAPLTVNTAGIGNLLELQKGGSPRLYVDNSGNAYATGSVVSGVNVAGQKAFVANGGNVDGIYINNPGTQGKAAQFLVTSGGNNNPALNSANDGTGRAAYFETGSTASATDTVFIKNGGNNANSSLLGGDHTGSAGNLIRLQSGGVDKFVVDKNGTITTGSASDNTKVAKAGDTMTGGLVVTQGGATATISAYQTGASDDAGYFLVSNAGSTAAAVSGVNNSTSPSSVGVNGQTAGGGTGVYGSNNTDGYGVQGVNSGSGIGVYGEGKSGRAAYFRINATGSSTDTVWITTNSNNAASSLLGGDHTGSAGNLINLRSGGTSRFVVDRNGTITTGSSSDTTKVLKSGDTMTGPLLVNFNTATESLKITNNTGTGLWIDGTGATAATASLYVKTNNTNANSYAIRGDHSSSGSGVFGTAAGGGYGVRGENSSSGSGVFGENSSAGNGVFGYNTGTGYAGYFEIGNPGNSSAVLLGDTTGTGNLLQLQTGGVNSFVVDNTGNLFASGSLRLPTSNYLNFGATLGTGGYGFRDNAGTMEFKNNAGSWAAFGGGNFVNKVGDTMTGPLLVNFNTATESLKITNNTGTGLMVDGTGATAATASLYVVSDNTTTSSYAIRGEHSGAGDSVYGNNTGTGRAGYFQINNTSNSKAAVYGKTIGTGRAGYFEINNAANNTPAVDVFTNGTTKAGLFQISNAANTDAALSATTNGTGAALSGYTTGTGKAGYFEVNRNTSATDTVWITTNSNNAASSLLGGNHTGSAGNLIKLQSGGVDKFVVDKNGVITTGGGRSCPVNTTDNGGTWRWCVDDTPRATAGFVAAVTTCAGAGGMICTLGEWLAACQAGAFSYTQFQEHWINADNGLASSATMTPDGATCSAGNMDVGNQPWATPVNYLCCFNK